MSNKSRSLTVFRMQILVIFFAPVFAWAAETTVQSDEFNGLGPKVPKLPGSCLENPQPSIYQQVSPMTVSASGAYTIADAYNNLLDAGDITIAVYQGGFNPNDVEDNLVSPGGFDDTETLQLSSGVNYTLVVQPWCNNIESAWAVFISGPGSVSSPEVINNLPAFTQGTFETSDPMINSDCGNSRYHQSGPFQVSRKGDYFFIDFPAINPVAVCISFYDGPPDAMNPLQHRIGYGDEFGWLSLEPGKDYYVIMQPTEPTATGDYSFLFVPPARFRLNPGLAGSWKNPATGGQGFFLDVFPNIAQVFLAWFTYDLERPDGSVTAQIGDPGHRWLTAFGKYSWNSADLDIEWTEGGVFDSGTPKPTQTVDGSILLEFTGCNSGTVTYDLGASNASGVVPIQRIANDNVALCEALATFGPGKAGSL